MSVEKATGTKNVSISNADDTQLLLYTHSMGTMTMDDECPVPLLSPPSFLSTLPLTCTIYPSLCPSLSLLMLFLTVNTQRRRRGGGGGSGQERKIDKHNRNHVPLSPVPQDSLLLLLLSKYLFPHFILLCVTFPRPFNPRVSFVKSA